MRRILFMLSFFALFAGSAWAQNTKLSKHLNDKLAKSKPSDVVRVIIQHVTPPSAADFGAVTGNGGKVNHQFKTIPALAVEVPAKALKGLANNPNVKYISLDEPITSHSEMPGQPYVVTGAQSANQTYGVTGQGIGVAVIDSGIANHPDLTVAQAVDFVNPSNTGGNDPYGHGTHVAGIIAASGASSGGATRGMAPNVNLVDLRVLDQSGSGYASDAISALEWAVANAQTTGRNGRNLNIRVVNMSLGYLPADTAANDPLAQACRAAVQHGMVVVAAAGNLGKDANGNPVYEAITSPGIEPSVITVAAMDTWATDTRSDDTVATYSSRGPTPLDHFLKPDIAAPGQAVLSTIPAASYLATTYPSLVNGNYMQLSGTSMAAGVVTGAAALLLQADPNLTPNALKGALMFTAQPEPAVINAPITVGAGYMNVAGAVNMVTNIDHTASSGQSWIKNNGLGLNYHNTIGGDSAIWSQNLKWASQSYSSNAMLYNAGLWGQTIVWDDTIIWDDTIVWSDTIIWDEAVIAAQTIVWDDTIVWADTVIWGETVGNDN